MKRTDKSEENGPSSPSLLDAAPSRTSNPAPFHIRHQQVSSAVMVTMTLTREAVPMN